MTDEVDQLKQKGNEYFIAKDFRNAVDLYSQALALCTDNDVRKVLLTNRSAAKLGLENYPDAVQDAKDALEIDPSHIKAYYRKAAALEAWNKLGDAYYCWLAAEKFCDPRQEILSKQIRKTKAAWVKVFRQPTFPITDVEDLTQRLLLFTDKRERLSTLAHFWNSSSLHERFTYFQVLLGLIGGSGDLSESNQEHITPEVMVEMPMANYVDMPRSRLADWFDFFDTLSSDARTEVFKRVWMHLSSEEQNDVIRDLRYLFGQAAEDPQADLIGVEVVENNPGEGGTISQSTAAGDNVDTD
jgi:hypothetical protein